MQAREPILPTRGGEKRQQKDEVHHQWRDAALNNVREQGLNQRPETQAHEPGRPGEHHPAQSRSRNPGRAHLPDDPDAANPLPRSLPCNPFKEGVVEKP